MFDFNKDNVELYQDIETKLYGKTLILKEVYFYEGPITLQALPYGGIQSVFGYHLIIFTRNGFIACDKVNYDGDEMTSKEFITKYEDLVNLVLPN